MLISSAASADDDHIRDVFSLIEQLDVARLLIHCPHNCVKAGDNVKSELVDDLIAVAHDNGTIVDGEFAGTTYFGVQRWGARDR